MSVSIIYFAFNRDRADAEWSHIKNLDLELIADAHQKKTELQNQLDKFTSDLHAIQTAEAYLHQQGIEHPDDVHIFNTEAAIERGEIDWPPIHSENQLQQKRDLEQRLSQIIAIPPELNDTDFLFALWPRETTFFGPEYERASPFDFLQDIIHLDLTFGSVIVSVSDTDGYEQFTEALVQLFLPERTTQKNQYSEQLFRENIVTVFERMSKDKILRAFQNPVPEFLQIIGIRPEDLSWFPAALIEFAMELRPVAKDIKENGSRLILGGDGSEQEDAELQQRGKQLFDFLLNKFQGLRQDWNELLPK